MTRILCKLAVTSLAAINLAAADDLPPGEMIHWWSFDTPDGDLVADQARDKKDQARGKFEYVPGIKGTALKLDGFRTFVERQQGAVTRPPGAFTVEGWVALASYPWSWAPVLDCSQERLMGYCLGLGPQGSVRFGIAAGASWFEATTQRTIPLREWVHVAAVFEPDKNIRVFIDGKEEAALPVAGNYVAPRRAALTLGRTHLPQTWHEFQLTTENTHFFLDGLLDEIRVTARAKPAEEFLAARAAASSPPPPALSVRGPLPKGPRGSGSFGAFHTRLDYYKEWDDLWRVGKVSDLFVRFDASPVQFVFWRGAGYVPCWVTENDIWYTNEWLETWGPDVSSCAEPLMDRDCRFSHVRLIENTPARVVIHWRYALADTFYKIAAVGDDGRGEWCDEFHIIYPDQVGIRRMELHYSKPERKHDWVEQIVVLPPGRHPDDAVERSAVSLVNMKGEVRAYSWHDDLPLLMDEPPAANMSVVHLKSRHHPFFIVPPGPVKTVEGTWDSPFFRSYAAKMGDGFRHDPAPSVYGWWNHWPVAQVPGDGRWVVTPDRPSHFNLTTFVQWNDLEKTERTRTRIMLQGMTDKEPAALVPLAKSWLQPPPLKRLAGDCGDGRYDPAERAYLVQAGAADKNPSCRMQLDASPDSPMVNPAIIIRDWGHRRAAVTVSIGGKPQTADIRQGIRSRPEGDDLILWIKAESQQAVEIAISRAEGQ